MPIHVRSVFAALILIVGLTPAAPAHGGPASSHDANWTLGGAPCRLIEVPSVAAAPPVGVGACPGVRPGAIVRSAKGQCTFNFLFTGSDGSRYIGTAGHCILGDSPTAGDVGEKEWAPGAGPVARDGGGKRIGRFVYAVLRDPKDFALIRLDPGVDAQPQMCHFGGPTGVNTERPGLLAPVVLHHFGQGLGLGTTAPGRSAVALGMPDRDHVYAEGIAAPGDSGSGIISADGRAVGVVVTVGVHLAGLGSSGADAGTMGVTRLGPQVHRAERALGLDLTLETAPLG